MISSAGPWGCWSLKSGSGRASCMRFMAVRSHAWMWSVMIVAPSSWVALGVCPGSEEPLVPPKLHDGFIGCGGLGCHGDHLDPVVVTGVGDWVTSHGCLNKD